MKRLILAIMAFVLYGCGPVSSNSNENSDQKMNEITYSLEKLDVEEVKTLVENPDTERLNVIGLSNHKLFIEYFGNESQYGEAKSIICYDLDTKQYDIKKIDEGVNVVYDAIEYENKLLYCRTFEEQVEVMYGEQVLIEKTNDRYHIFEINQIVYIVKMVDDHYIIYQFNGELTPVMELENCNGLYASGDILAITTNDHKVHYIYNEIQGEYEKLDLQKLLLADGKIYHRDGSCYDLNNKEMVNTELKLDLSDCISLGDYMILDDYQGIGYISNGTLYTKSMNQQLIGDYYQLDQKRAVYFQGNDSSRVDALEIDILTFEFSK